MLSTLICTPIGSWSIISWCALISLRAKRPVAVLLKTRAPAGVVLLSRGKADSAKRAGFCEEAVRVTTLSVVVAASRRMAGAEHGRVTWRPISEGNVFIVLGVC